MRKQVNILVVDDRDENLMAVEAVLSDPAYRLVRAKSGREALKEVLDQDFALILLDVVMPDVDGYETATLIRERPRSRQTPIIFLTANDWGTQHVFRGYTVGAVDYLVKPVPADVLRSKVAVFVELFNRQEALRIGQEELEQRIADRTRQLAVANVALSAEIDERARIEKERVQLLRRDCARFPPWNHSASCCVGFHMLRGSPSQGPGSLVVPEPRPQTLPTLSAVSWSTRSATQPFIEPKPVA